MRLLLDSHVLLWWLGDDPRLGGPVRAALADPDTPVLVSAASIWELGIKAALGKVRAPRELAGILREEGFEPLPISVEHAEAASSLPPLHRDPFDRMLVAQARLEGLTLVTHDERVQAYDVAVLKV